MEPIALVIRSIAEKQIDPSEPIPVLRVPEPYVDAVEGSAFLHMHPKTLMRLAREGTVRAYSFSDGVRHHWRFLISELDAWMKTRVNSTSNPVRPCPANGRRK
jgi:hypothetical protein